MKPLINYEFETIYDLMFIDITSFINSIYIDQSFISNTKLDDIISKWKEKFATYMENPSLNYLPIIIARIS